MKAYYLGLPDGMTGLLEQSASVVFPDRSILNVNLNGADSFDFDFSVQDNKTPNEEKSQAAAFCDKLANIFEFVDSKASNVPLSGAEFIPLSDDEIRLARWFLCVCAEFGGLAGVLNAGMVSESHAKKCVYRWFAAVSEVLDFMSDESEGGNNGETDC